MIIGKLDADGWKIKEVDIPEREPIFCEVCEKEVKDMNANIFQKLFYGGVSWKNGRVNK